MIAMRASIEAAKAILEIYDTDFSAAQKDDGSPVTEADIRSSKILNEELKKTSIPIIGEEIEISSYDERSKWKENWCLDPLDGTRMFLRKNDEFCISIAHVVNNQPVFGILTSPVTGEILFGGKGHGVFISTFNDLNEPENWEKMKPHEKLNNPVVIICSRSYTHGSGFKYMQLLEREFGELAYLRKGSALKFFDLARGNADIYARFHPTMEWDIAAGHAILNALEGTIVDVKENKPLRYNKEDLFNPQFIAKSKAILKH